MTDKYAYFHLKNMHIYLGKETKYLGEEYNGQKWSNYSKRMNKVQHNAKIKILVFENAWIRIKLYLTWSYEASETNMSW